MKKAILLAVVGLITVQFAIAQQVTIQDAMAKVSKGKPFTLVILRPGDVALPADPKSAQKMQMDHLVNLFQMEKDGKISVFGPVMKDSTMDGIIIFNSTDKTTIKKELENDPFIKAGHLKFDMYDWFSIPGQKLPE